MMISIISFDGYLEGAVTMKFLDQLKSLYHKDSCERWSDFYRQLEDAAANGETSTTFTENFGMVRDLVEMEGLQHENGKHEVQFIKVGGWDLKEPVGQDSTLKKVWVCVEEPLWCDGAVNVIKVVGSEEKADKFESECNKFGYSQRAIEMRVE